MMSNGAGEATDSGEDAAAIDAYNAYAIAYNQNVAAYNAQVTAYNASLGANDFVQAGLDNAKAAMLEVARGHLSEGCIEWVNDIGASAPRPFTAAALQAEAAASAGYIYDGSSSPTAMSSIGYPLPGTVGDLFKADSEVKAMSQPTGHAVWVRSSSFVSKEYLGANGLPTGAAKAAMMHEEMHKFGYTDPGMANKMGVPAETFRTWGSLVLASITELKCYGSN
jgi:hypothetical protein